MKYHFLRIPVIDDGSIENELNRFCAGHSVMQVERHFVDNGDLSFWAVCVSYLESDNKSSSASRQRIDYREVLDDDDFAIFAKLRAARKAIAESEGVPVYSVFTNEQLALMVTQRVRSKTDMRAIDGIGATRVEKYAERMLPILIEGGRGDRAPTTNQS